MMSSSISNGSRISNGSNGSKNEQKPKIKRVAAYVRVSTLSKDQENSFENQHAIIQQAVEKAENTELVKIYADRGLSATSEAKRKEFLQMVHDAGVEVRVNDYKFDQKYKIKLTPIETDREPLFDEIWVKNTSRLARNIEIVPFVRALRQKGVTIYFMDIDKSTANEGDQMIIDFFTVFDQNDSADKSRKVRAGQMQGAKKGTMMFGSRLYGYEKVDRYTLKEISEEAETIRYIYTLYSQGNGIRKIVQILKDEGYTTREGKAFSKSSVSKMLENPTYKGDLVRNRMTTGVVYVNKTATPKKIDPEHWVVHENHPGIPVIVDRSLWDECQRLRQSKVNVINQKGVYHGTDEFTGLVKCGKCGNSYTRNIDRGRVFYNCSLKKREGRVSCNNGNVSLSVIDELLEELQHDGFREMLKREAEFELYQMLQVKEEITALLNQDISAQISELASNLSDLEQRQAKLTDIYLDGKINQSIFDERNNKLLADIESTKKQIKDLSMTDKDRYNELERIDTIIEQVAGIANEGIDKEYSREDIMEQIEEISVVPVLNDKGYETGEVDLYPRFTIIQDIFRLNSKYLGYNVE